MTPPASDGNQLQVGADQPGAGCVAAVPRCVSRQPRGGGRFGAVVRLGPAAGRPPLAAHGGLACLGDLAQVCRVDRVLCSSLHLPRAWTLTAPSSPASVPYKRALPCFRDNPWPVLDP